MKSNKGGIDTCKPLDWGQVCETQTGIDMYFAWGNVHVETLAQPLTSFIIIPKRRGVSMVFEHSFLFPEGKG